MEFLGGLYFDEVEGPYLPDVNIAAFFVAGAKKMKLGVQAKEALLITSDVNPLVYDGPRTLTGLWDDTSFRLTAMVRVENKRVMRCRPIFRQWAVEATAELDTEILDLDMLQRIGEVAGQRIGIGDWRPRYGRCSVEVAAA